VHSTTPVRPNVVSSACGKLHSNGASGRAEGVHRRQRVNPAGECKVYHESALLVFNDDAHWYSLSYWREVSACRMEAAESSRAESDDGAGFSCSVNFRRRGKKTWIGFRVDECQRNRRTSHSSVHIVLRHAVCRGTLRFKGGLAQHVAHGLPTHHQRALLLQQVHNHRHCDETAVCTLIHTQGSP